MNIPRKSKFRPFVEARAFVRGLKFQGKNDYAIWSKTPERPSDIPTTPAQVYKTEWTSWGDWLGTYTVSTNERAFRPFAEAREYVRSLQFKGYKEYSIWSKTPERPDDIPSTPSETYKTEWTSWGDWLGTNRLANKNKIFRPFVEAREYVRSLQFIGQKEYSIWSKTPERPDDIPVVPSMTYKTEWINWGDWLGTNTVSTNQRTFRPFAEARAFVRGLKFQGKNDYAIWSKTPERPSDIPTTPAQVYKTEWTSWGDWLGRACKLFCVNADGTLIVDRAADHQIQ